MVSSTAKRRTMPHGSRVEGVQRQDPGEKYTKNRTHDKVGRNEERTLVETCELAGSGNESCPACLRRSGDTHMQEFIQQIPPQAATPKRRLLRLLKKLPGMVAERCELSDLSDDEVGTGPPAVPADGDDGQAREVQRTRLDAVRLEVPDRSVLRCFEVFGTCDLPMTRRQSRKLPQSLPQCCSREKIVTHSNHFKFASLPFS